MTEVITKKDVENAISNLPVHCQKSDVSVALLGIKVFEVDLPMQETPGDQKAGTSAEKTEAEKLQDQIAEIKAKPEADHTDEEKALLEANLTV